MKWLPPAVGTVLLLILLLGLVLVVRENMRVAPWASGATDGRMHFQLKNATRLAGDPEQVRRLVWRAVYLDHPPEGLAAPPQDWAPELLRSVAVAPSPRHVIVLPAGGEDVLPWALPGAYWAAYSGAPIVFASGDALSSESLETVRRYGLPTYVLAPPALIGEGAVSEIARLVPTQRVAGDDPIDHAALLAQVRDPVAEFGWGRTYDERDGYFQYVLTTPSEARQALAAIPLARSNAATLLYMREDGGVPAQVDRYLWKQRADWFVTPAEGPFRHLWIVGDRTTYAAQARLDFALEKAPYASRGPAAFGPLEGLAVVFIALGWAGALFVFLHGQRLLPEVPLGMRIAWSFTALLAPVIGVVLYLGAYRRVRLEPRGSAPQYFRPATLQSAAATAMSFGYGAPIMIVIGYAFVYFGLPQFFGAWVIDGWEFLFGAGMVLMMLAMWAGAILLAWPLVQLPMHTTLMPGMPRWKLTLRTLLITALSMSAVSLGMMTSAWWLQMLRLPEMPHEDEILWFGAMWLASTIGFLVAWPLNYPMVRTRLKMGGV